MRQAEIILGAILVPAWLGITFYVIPNYVGAGDGSGLAPAFMPTVGAVCGLAFAIALLIDRIFRMRGSAGPNPMPLKSWLFFGCMIVTVVGGLAIIEDVGYLWGAPVIVGGFVLLVRAKPIHAILTVILTPLFLWGLFWGLLKIPLP